MTEVRIRTRLNGPLIVTGPVTVTDHLGNPFPIEGQKDVALCRCGHSRKRPFCDGSHRQHDFQASELAPANDSSQTP